MSWLLWGLLLLVQNASFTWVSRARNSSDLKYHATAAFCSNGVWFLGPMMALDKLAEARAAGSVPLFIATALFYTVCTVTGSVGAHHLLQTKVETGKRKVGG
jgi:hypothetical protein